MKAEKIEHKGEKRIKVDKIGHFKMLQRNTFASQMRRLNFILIPGLIKKAIPRIGLPYIRSVASGGEPENE